MLLKIRLQMYSGISMRKLRLSVATADFPGVTDFLIPLWKRAGTFPRVVREVEVAGSNPVTLIFYCLIVSHGEILHSFEEDEAADD